MTTVSIASMHSVPAMRTDDQSPGPFMLLCCVGLVASFCLMTFGIDLSAGWV
jgi:hypothetical protein